MTHLAAASRFWTAQLGGSVSPADLWAAGLQIAALGLLAGVIGLAAGFVYRWYARERLPEGIAVLFGAVAVSASLNTEGALADAIIGQSDLLDPATAAVSIAALVVGGVLADVGRRLGDRTGQRVGGAVDVRNLGDMGRVVRTRGRSVTVELPPADDLEDIDGYDPVSDETKADLGGTTLSFPRGLTVAELRDRLVERLKTDHGVGRVDVELTPEGDVEYLALGSHAAGIGSTLGPGTAAVAVRADPPNSASAGDTVQVWTGGEDPELVATAEFRGATGDVATLALDETDARELGEGEYRLVTLPGTPAADREFAALLRAAEETMGAVTVGEGASLVGRPLGDLGVTVAAVRTAEGVEAIPSRDRAAAAGDTLYAIARPDALRRFEEAARAADPAEDGEEPEPAENAGDGGSGGHDGEGSGGAGGETDPDRGDDGRGRPAERETEG